MCGCVRVDRGEYVCVCGRVDMDECVSEGGLG